MTILALDLGAAVCGFAHGPQTARLPAFGSWHLPKLGPRGLRYVALENMLARHIREWEITAIVVESPLPIMALFNSHGDLQASSQAIRVQHTLAGFAEAEAARASAKYSEVSADIVRAAVLGQRRFPKGEVKDYVISYCRSHGLDVPDDHAADACLVWIYMVAQLTGRALAGPLFREES